MGKKWDNRAKLAPIENGKKWPKNTEKMENRAFFPFFRYFSAIFSPFSIGANFPRFSHFFPIFVVRPVFHCVAGPHDCKIMCAKLTTIVIFFPLPNLLSPTSPHPTPQDSPEATGNGLKRTEPDRNGRFASSLGWRTREFVGIGGGCKEKTKITKQTSHEKSNEMHALSSSKYFQALFSGIFLLTLRCVILRTDSVAATSEELKRLEIDPVPQTRGLGGTPATLKRPSEINSLDSRSASFDWLL